MANLNEQVVIVTGSGKGIGKVLLSNWVIKEQK